MRWRELVPTSVLIYGAEPRMYLEGLCGACLAFSVQYVDVVYAKSMVMESHMMVNFRKTFYCTPWFCFKAYICLSDILCNTVLAWQMLHQSTFVFQLIKSLGATNMLLIIVLGLVCVVTIAYLINLIHW